MQPATTRRNHRCIKYSVPSINSVYSVVKRMTKPTHPAYPHTKNRDHTVAPHSPQPATIGIMPTYHPHPHPPIRRTKTPKSPPPSNLPTLSILYRQIALYPTDYVANIVRLWQSNGSQMAAPRTSMSTRHLPNSRLILLRRDQKRGSTSRASNSRFSMSSKSIHCSMKRSTPRLARSNRPAPKSATIQSPQTGHNLLPSASCLLITRTHAHQNTHPKRRNPCRAPNCPHYPYCIDKSPCISLIT